MSGNKLTPPSDKQKKHFSHYLAEGEEIIAIFGIGERYFWYTVVGYIMIIIFLLVYPAILHIYFGIFEMGERQWLMYLPGILTAIIGLPFILKLIHLKHKLTYIFTDRRVLVKDGVLSVKTISAPYDKITHMTVREDFFKKLSYQMGDITIHTAGPTPVEIDLIKVQYPMKVKNLLEELTIKERSLLGVVSKKAGGPVNPFE